MDSIGSGEIFVILVVALLALDPRTAARWWRKFQALRGKLFDLRAELEREVAATAGIADPPDEPGLPAKPDTRARLRRWASERVEALPPEQVEQAPAALSRRLRAWDLYRDAKAVAAFWPLAGELPLESALQCILDDGKELWLPWLGQERGHMDMARVENLGRDLAAGRWNLREPREALRGGRLPEGALVLVPGSVFDLHGGRIGKGGGFYDRWLALRPDVTAVGTCWDAQVHPGRLPLAPHDIAMHHLLTDLRLVPFPRA